MATMLSYKKVYAPSKLSQKEKKPKIKNAPNRIGDIIHILYFLAVWLGMSCLEPFAVECIDEPVV